MQPSSHRSLVSILLTCTLSACNSGSSLQNKPSCRFVLDTIKQRIHKCPGSFPIQANQDPMKGKPLYLFPQGLQLLWGLHNSHVSFLGSLQQRCSTSLKLQIEFNYGLWKTPLGDQKSLPTFHLVEASPSAAVSSCVFSEEVQEEIPMCSSQHLFKAADRPLRSY